MYVICFPTAIDVEVQPACAEANVGPLSKFNVVLFPSVKPSVKFNPVSITFPVLDMVIV